ncbi:UNVERIFIED_CONTAM: hypothetical protein Slati_3163900 [Sesamum latifolium]|uniref:Reverse transcriptase Ty1/copia-type domain-containing protein n=1 Tax=Sesamum latifolium TaxID=2727402 RepID=A0AAW2UYL0_9LAMI
MTIAYLSRALEMILLLCSFILMMFYSLVTSPSSELIIEVKMYLDNVLTIKDLGLARYFFGLQIARSASGTSLNQVKYIQDILKDTGLSAVRAATTPLPQGMKLSVVGGAVLFVLNPTDI